MVAEGGLHSVGQVESLLLGPGAEPAPMSVIGTAGILGPGILTDLAAPGYGSAGGGDGLKQQNLVLLKCRIKAIIRRLIRSCKGAKPACSGMEGAGAGPPLSPAVSWSELRQRV